MCTYNMCTYKLLSKLFLSGLWCGLFSLQAEPVVIKMHDPLVMQTAVFLKVPRKNFFEDITGLPESVWLTTDRQACLITDKHNAKKHKIKNIATQQEFDAGIFQELSLEQVRQEADKLSSTNTGTFNVRAGYNTAQDSWFRRCLDVGALQADPSNNDAVFQVASNFSALEPTSISHYPEAGITNYIHDHTQGPYAAISAAPGPISRMYYLFYNSQTNADTSAHIWRQTRDHQVNLLDQVAEYFPVVNGYVDLHGALDKKLAGNTSTLSNKIKIGFHEGIQVTHGFVQGNYHESMLHQDQTINQVFTAGIDFGDLNRDLRNNPEAIARALILLEAAYEATLKAAAINNKKQVFLTLIGGGVFNNNILWIAQALEKQKEFIKQSGLQVTLILYSYTQFTEFHERMLALTQQTGGEFHVYKTDGAYRVIK